MLGETRVDMADVVVEALCVGLLVFTTTGTVVCGMIQLFLF
jgi:hypothetical protein